MSEVLNNEVSVPDAQAEWNSILKERESGVDAEATPQNKPDEQVVEKTVAAAAPVDPILERLEKLETRTRNAEGYIGGLNHNQKMMQESLLAATKAAQQQVADSPTDRQVREAMADPEKWKSLKGQFPEFAEATEEMFDAKLSSIQAQANPDAIARIVQEQVKGQTAEVRKEIINASLDAVYPEWQDDVKSDRFKNWIAGQPDSVKSLADSVNVKDAAKMLSLFERAKSTLTASEKLAGDVIASRSKKLANASSTPKGSKPIAAKAYEDMTPQEQWNYEANRREKAKAQQY